MHRQAQESPEARDHDWKLDCDRMDTVQEKNLDESDRSGSGTAGGDMQEDQDEDISWGSEFDVDIEALEDFDKVDADSTMSVMDMIHRVFWKGESIEEDHSTDGTGRYQYILDCRNLQTRPSVQIALGLAEPSLLLQNQNLGSKEFHALAAALTSNTNVTELNLSNNVPGDEGIVALATALKCNACIQSLILRGNVAGPNSGSAWAKALLVNESLTYLDMASCKLGDSSVSLIVDAIRRNKLCSIRHFDLSDNLIGCKGAKSLSSFLSRNGTLTLLDISWNQVLPNDLRLLCQAASSNTALKALSLAWNGIGDQESRFEKIALETPLGQDEERHAIVELVSSTKSIEQLDITNCRLGSHLGQALARAILQNTSIKYLKMDGNPFGDGALEIQQALNERMRARTLFRFSLLNCSFDPLRRIEYDSTCVCGFYRLDLSQSKDLEICKKLVVDAKITHGEAWRNERLNGIRFTYPPDAIVAGKQVAQTWPIPTSGILEIDVVTIDDFDEDIQVFEPQRFKAFLKALDQIRCDSARIGLLKSACQAYCLTSSQALKILYIFPLESWRENALVLMFQSIVDKANLHVCNAAISDRSRLILQKRIGPFYLMNRSNPSGKYVMDLAKHNDRNSLLALLSLFKKRPGARFLNIKYAGNAQDPFVSLFEVSSEWQRIKDVVESAQTDPALQVKGVLEFEFECPQIIEKSISLPSIGPRNELRSSHSRQRDALRSRGRLESQRSERRTGSSRSESRDHPDRTASGGARSAGSSRSYTGSRPGTGASALRNQATPSSSRLRLPEVQLDPGMRGIISDRKWPASMLGPLQGTSSSNSVTDENVLDGRCTSSRLSSTRSPKYVVSSPVCSR